MDFPKVVKYFAPIFFILYNVWWYLSDSMLAWFTKLSAAGALAIISWTLAYYVLESLYTDTVSPTGKAVLITGCDTGFGHELAARLDRFGFTVFAGVLFPEGEGAQKLARGASKRLKLLKMDVTKADEVEAAISAVRASGLPLWAVVNNAGIGFGAFFDWGEDVEVYRKLFEVNIFGVIRVTKAAMPLLRQSSGRIVNVASLAGRISVPTMVHYNMAKHSVRVFSDTIRREFALTGDAIKVVTIEPTFYRTEIVNAESMKRFRVNAYNSSPEEIKKVYSAVAPDRWFDKAQVVIDTVSRTDLSEVTEAMENAVTLEHPKLFYRCGGYHDVIIWALSHLPEIIFDYFINNRFGHAVLSVYVKVFGGGKA